MTIQEMALNLPEVTEEPHFEKTSFRVNKKIFLTLNIAQSNAVVKLSLIDQDVFSSMSNGAVSPIDNKWGTQGWTQINMNTVDQNLLQDIVKTAYKTVAPKKFIDRMID